MESFFRIKEKITTIGPETVFNIGSFPVVNSFLMILVILVFLIALTFFIKKRFKVKPSKFQLFVELLYEQMMDLTSQLSGSDVYTKKIFPLVAGLFVYLGLANLIGLVPGLTEITYQGISIFRTPTADFNTTFGLALALIILIQLVGIGQVGIFGYLGKFFKFKEVYVGFKAGIGQGLVAVIDFLVGLLDIISEFAKVISLSLRLFGNMYAGQVLAVVALGALAYGLPLFPLALGIFSGIIQAMVFGALVAAYYMSMVTHEPSEK